MPKDLSCDTEMEKAENELSSGEPDEYSDGDGEFFDLRLVILKNI